MLVYTEHKTITKERKMYFCNGIFLIFAFKVKNKNNSRPQKQRATVNIWFIQVEASDA